MLSPISKNEARSFVRKMERSKSNVKFSSRKEKNGRGDYGCSETLSVDGVPVIVISVDGARIDVRFYVDEEMMQEKGII